MNKIWRLDDLKLPCESESVSYSVVSDSLQCCGLWPTREFSVHGILQARIPEWVAFPSPVDLPDPGIELGSPILQEDSLPSEPPGWLSVSRSVMSDSSFPWTVLSGLHRCHLSWLWLFLSTTIYLILTSRKNNFLVTLITHHIEIGIYFPSTYRTILRLIFISWHRYEILLSTASITHWWNSLSHIWLKWNIDYRIKEK